jgi:hypothetical protein
MLLELQSVLALSNITTISVLLNKASKIEKINKEEVIRVEVQYCFFIFLNNSTNLEFVSSICNFVKKETYLVFDECLIDHKFDTSILK